ncbi:loricrin-like isoform X1 [Stomoxys calcitrans]|uniref:Uncharacterized protein n=1 Tax=Stomoxys calcitrans TaxID=35570 RepID=A0A1I8Q4Y5_STOCA|nr:loricrin isoform X1 [Stomoxys calcitrans]XP_059217092.1 loricrin-like isoform X1 [Stomoxys calcitrans]XP_059217094.1 loricrin-like isoform X1 [Stomoxys calcitrans]
MAIVKYNFYVVCGLLVVISRSSVGQYGGGGMGYYPYPYYGGGGGGGCGGYPMPCYYQPYPVYNNPCYTSVCCGCGGGAGYGIGGGMGGVMGSGPDGGMGGGVGGYPYYTSGYPYYGNTLSGTLYAASNVLNYATSTASTAGGYFG